MKGEEKRKLTFTSMKQSSIAGYQDKLATKKNRDPHRNEATVPLSLGCLCWAPMWEAVDIDRQCSRWRG